MGEVAYPRWGKGGRAALAAALAGWQERDGTFQVQGPDARGVRKCEGVRCVGAVCEWGV